MSRFLYDILYFTRLFSEIIYSFILRAFCCEWFSEFALQLPSHVVKLASKSEETGGAVAERESASAQAGVAKHRRDGHIRQRTQRTWRSSQWLPEQERKSVRRERRLLYSVIAPFRCFVCSIIQYFFALFFDIVQCIKIFLTVVAFVNWFISRWCILEKYRSIHRFSSKFLKFLTEVFCA